MIYPWQKLAWQEIVKNWQTKPNAWLFYGSKNTGNLDFVQEYAKALLCEQSNVSAKVACGQCQSCYLYSQMSHPDFYNISEWQEDSNKSGRLSELIKIDEIRHVSEKLQSSSYLGGWKVVLMEPAEAMNTQAANALLKVLEEPPTRTIFLLVSYAKDKLLPTIVSRCRKFSLPVPNKDESLQYLQTLKNFSDKTHFQLAFNSDMPFFEENFPYDLYQEFLDMLLQPRLLLCLEFAQHYESQFKSLTYFFDWIYKWLSDLILAIQGYEIKFNLSSQVHIEKIKSKYRLDDLFSLLKLVKKQAHDQNHPLSIKLQIENIILEYLLLSIR